MKDFSAEILERENKLKTLATEAVNLAIKAGADQCVAASACVQGIGVSSRDGEVENIEFNRDNGISITVYKGHRRGSASTTDLSFEALKQTAESAVSLASFSDPDECAGLPDQDLLCKDFKDLKVLHRGFNSPEDAVSFAVSIDRLGKNDKRLGLKNSDGASADYTLYTNCLASSDGFCHAKSSSLCSADITMLGESNGKMQRASGFTVARSPKDLADPIKVEQEAALRTIEKLDALTVKTGKYNVIFTRSAVQSLLSNFAQAISGGALYRRGSFLCDCLNTKVMPEFVSIFEDPFIEGSFGADNCDSEGVASKASNIVESGILKQYLLSSYTARKLNMRSNGHAGGKYNWFVNFDAEYTVSFDNLLAEAGEGIVIDELMGQGVDLTSGNYSRGAAGFYFKNGKKVHAVSEITVAGNLKDMFMNMAMIGTDRDPRYKVQVGSILIPNLTISGS